MYSNYIVDVISFVSKDGFFIVTRFSAYEYNQLYAKEPGQHCWTCDLIISFIIGLVGNICLVDKKKKQEEHVNIRAMKSDSYSLEWSDYKSMPFTQCVSVFALSF